MRSAIIVKKSLFVIVFLMFSFIVFCKSEYLDKGINSFNNKKYSGAVIYFKQGLSNDENPGVIWYNLGNTYYIIGKVGEAVDAYKKVISIAPYFSTSYLNLAKIYLQLEDIGEAFCILNELINLKPKDTEALILLGDCYLLVDETVEALKNYEKAMYSNFKNPVSYIALSDAYLELEDYNSSIDIIKEGIENIPESVELRILLGDVYLETGKYADASSVLLEVTRMKETDTLLRYKYAYASYYNSQIYTAIENCKQCIFENPDFKPPYILLIEIYQNNDMPDKLEILLFNSYTNDPKWFKPYIKNLAAFYYNNNNEIKYKLIMDKLKNKY